MKLGFGLYRHMLDEQHYRFAKQCGATHLVVHLVDYFSHEKNNKDRANQPVGQKEGWGKAGSGETWSLAELLRVKEEINSHGLVLEAIENFDPATWYDILLAGKKRDEQLEGLKELIRNVGKAGIPCFGYYFSLAGVSGRTQGAYARGGALSVGMEDVDHSPIPNGMVWNMVYNESAAEGFIPPCTHEEIWGRLEYFLKAIIPVAEEAGVKLAAHPDDPPMPFLRGTPRLVYQPHLYQKLIDLYPSTSNLLEFCLGTLSEMTEGDIYDATDRYCKQGKLGYIHFRNVRGKAPSYREVFVDEGDVDMVRILRILKKQNFQGVLIPDHTPQIACDAPWYAGMAFAMGYMRAALRLIDES